MEQPSRSYTGPRVVWAARKAATLVASVPVCGISEPGIAASASSSRSSSATRMEVSCRQNQRAQPTTPSAGSRCAESSGAVESWEPASASSRSPVGSVGAVVLLIGQIPTVKPLDQVCMSCTMRSQAPVSSSTPVTIIIVPPILSTQV